MNDPKGILDEVKKAVVGKDGVLVMALLAILAGGHILLEDIPGVGKTTMALAFSKALSLKYNRVQFTPDVLPSDIVGFSVYNKATGWYETREVELKGYTFTDDDRILIVREYLESGVSAERIIKKYHISSRSVLFSWMDKFLNEKDLLPLQQEPISEEDMAKTKDERLKEKDAEIKRLRKALELEKLRSHAYSTMIDLAEQTFNIPVRKKSGTKQ